MCKKVTEERIMFTEKHVLDLKPSQMGLSLVFHNEPESKRQSMEWKRTDPIYKELEKQEGGEFINGNNFI